MQSISEADARAFFRTALYCEHAVWVALKHQPGTVVCESGLVDGDGRSSRLWVRLNYAHSPKTRKRICKFTIFLRNHYGLDRVYQLELNQFGASIKDAHKRSHSHIGLARTPGQAHWDNWGYDEAIEHFCSETNVHFVPPLPHPEHFALT